MIDHEVKVLAGYSIERLIRYVALRILNKAIKRYDDPEIVVTDPLASYGTATKMIRPRSTGGWSTPEQQD